MTTAVLVYNTTYEPVSYTRLARAVVLITRGDAVVEEALPDRVIRYKGGEIPWPKVIRLLRFVKVKVRYGPAMWSKRGVLKRDNHTCGYCGRTATTVDHIIPQSRNGERRCWLNTVAACVKCNGKKRDRTPAEARMHLQITPTTPMTVQLRF